jgi:hypothetical protein
MTMTTTHELPHYVDQLGHGEICFPQPLQLKDVTAYAFSLAADPNALQALVDSQMNVVCRPDLEYRVVGSSTLLTLLHVRQATSLAQTIGNLGDHEAAFWIPLLEIRKGRLIPRLVFWIPYLLIDVASGMVVGREIWGYRKSLGSIRLPSQDEQPARFTADTTMFKVFSATTWGEVGTLLEIRKDQSLGRLDSAWSSLKEAAQEIRKLWAHHHGDLRSWGDDGAIAVDLVEMIFDRIVRVVNLKQFRAAEDATRACYQAVVESPCHFDRLLGAGPLFGDYTLTVTTCASHRIVEDLGLGTVGTGGRTVVPVSFSFWIRWDFTTLNGKVLWSAP